MANQLQTIAWTMLLTFLLAACEPLSHLTVVQTASPTSTRQMYNLETPVPDVDAQITEAPDSRDLSNELDAMLQKATELNTFSGSVLVVQDGNVILSSGYGFADRGKISQITQKPDSQFARSLSNLQQRQS